MLVVDCRFAEVQVMILFVTLALLWLFREPRFMPGWAVIFRVDSESAERYIEKFTQTNDIIMIKLLSLQLLL